MGHVGLHVTVEHHALEDAETQTESTDLRNQCIGKCISCYNQLLHGFKDTYSPSRGYTIYAKRAYNVLRFI